MTASLSQLNIEQNILDLTAFTQALESLQNQSESLKRSYIQAQPYPHLVIEDLFAPELLERLIAEFPKAKNRDWLVWDTNHEVTLPQGKPMRASNQH